MTNQERLKIVDRLPDGDTGFAAALASAFRADRGPRPNLSNRTSPPAKSSDVDVPAASTSLPAEGGETVGEVVDLAMGRTTSPTGSTTTKGQTRT